MLFRLSKATADKLKVPLLPNIVPDINHDEWHAHTFRAGRLQFILVTHTSTLYSVLLRGAQISTPGQFVNNFQKILEMVLNQICITEAYTRYAKTKQPDVIFARTVDRRIIGSVNEKVHMVKFYLADNILDLIQISARLNEVPMGMYNYASPVKKIKELLGIPDFRPVRPRELS